MRIGIDISQIVYEGTGVAAYVRNLVSALVKLDRENEYVLFAGTLRQRQAIVSFYQSLGSPGHVRLVMVPIPPPALDLLWNRWHVLPVEWLTGPLDIFWSSDWTQPPLARARGVTTIHDVSFLRFPETFAKTIVDVQKRRLNRVRRECSAVFCDSQVTKRDVATFLGLNPERLHTVYPGFSY